MEIPGPPPSPKRQIGFRVEPEEKSGNNAKRKK